MSSKSNNKQTGDLGETATCAFLVRKGWNIVTRNYRRSYFEIDIIASYEGIIHFIEVKTVSFATQAAYSISLNENEWRPEELVHSHKLHKIGLGVESWLREFAYEGEWQVDVAAVKLVPSEKYATVKLIEDVGLQ